METLIMIKLEDVLNLIPKDDITGPKPSKLREDILKLPTYGCEIIEED